MKEAKDKSTLDEERNDELDCQLNNELHFDDTDEIVANAIEFLPQPEELVFKKETRKVTIALDQESIDFFKAEAKRLDVPYQRMIRVLLQEYVARAKQVG
jgi:predicted DNA binding CopG/RHH family protein